MADFNAAVEANPVDPTALTRRALLRAGNGDAQVLVGRCSLPQTLPRCRYQIAKPDAGQICLNLKIG